MLSVSFKLVADDAMLVEESVLSSYAVSSAIRCANLCVGDADCAYFTFIAHERACSLGQTWQDDSGSNFEPRQGARTYSIS